MLAVAGPVVRLGRLADGRRVPARLFGDHNLGRAAQTMEGHSGGSVVLPRRDPGRFLPLVGIRGADRHGCGGASPPRASWATGYVFAVCWIGVYVGLFSLAQTKLAQLCHALLSGLGLLTACFVRHWMRGTAAGWRRWPAGAIVTLGLVGLVMAVAIPLAARSFLPGEEWLAARRPDPLGGRPRCVLVPARAAIPASRLDGRRDRRGFHHGVVRLGRPCEWTVTSRIRSCWPRSNVRVANLASAPSAAWSPRGFSTAAGPSTN